MLLKKRAELFHGRSMVLDGFVDGSKILIEVPSVLKRHASFLVEPL